jgi:GNAT superfamily N-acetyltransferase
VSKSLYAQYVKEREGAEMLERPWGFAVYKWEKDHVYLQDIYVIPEKRKGGFGVGLMHAVADLAREKGLETMFGSVVPSTPFGHEMSQIMFKLGFRLHSSGHDIIYFRKDLKEKET